MLVTVNAIIMMERHLVAIEVPKAHICVSTGLFGRSFAVYEVRYTLSNPSQTDCTTKRYREFRTLHQSLGVSPLPTFPAKRYFERLKASVIEERRTLLQAWLQAVAKVGPLTKELLDFLGVGPAVPIGPYLSEEEKAVVDFEREVEADSRAKLRALDGLTVGLFAGKQYIRVEYLRRLLDLLVILSADHTAGGKALSILCRLTSREHYADAATVLQEWLSLGPERLRTMGLNLHLLQQMSRDTREEAFQLFKRIYDLWGSLGRTLMLKLVRARQLNESSEALLLFERWRQGKLSLGKSKPQEVSQAWRTVVSPKSASDFSLKYRFLGTGVEVSAEIRIDTDAESVMELVLFPEERKKWDLRIQSVRLLEGDALSRGTTELKLDLGEEEKALILNFSVSTKSPGLIVADYHIKDGSSAESLETYTFSSVSEASTEPTESQSAYILPEVAPEDSEDSIESTDSAVCLLRYTAHYPKSLGKAILPDLTGESENLEHSLENLKRLAEKGCLCLSSSYDHLSAAVARKSLTPKDHKHSRHRSNSFVYRQVAAQQLFRTGSSVVVT
jgi:hypothetical protein